MNEQNEDLQRAQSLLPYINNPDASATIRLMWLGLAFDPSKKSWDQPGMDLKLNSLNTVVGMNKAGNFEVSAWLFGARLELGTTDPMEVINLLLRMRDQAAAYKEQCEELQASILEDLVCAHKMVAQS